MKNRLLITAAFLLSSLYCIAQTPEINVRGNGVTIVDGDLVPTTADYSDFGSVLACNGTIVRTFNIQNLGTGNLNISSVVISGTNSSDYNVTLPPASLIVAGGSSMFQVIFDPSATGMRSALITINNDDADEASYDFGIQGTGNADIVNPSISCLSNINVNNSAGQCSAIVTYTAPVGTDNCPSSTTTQIAGLPSGSAFPVGVTVNTFRVTDGSGNTATCSFSVTVTDTEAPVLYTASCGPISFASAIPYTDGWQSGDNEPTSTGFSAWTLAASTGNTSQAGFLRASSTTNGAGTDSNGDQDIDISGLAFGIYANSAQAAEAVRPFLAPLANGSSVSAEFDNGSVDPGQIVGFQIQNSSGNSLGEIRYRGGQAGYEIVDANGITPFTLIPFTDEGIIIEVTSLSTGLASIKLTRKVNGATQTIVSTLFPGGGNQLIRRVKIFNSNAGSGISKNLFVNKLKLCTTTPGCPSNVNVSNDAGVCGATVVYNTLLVADNCSSGLSVTQTAGLASGSLFPVGITTNSFSVTDVAGNTATCSFSVTVNDVEPPTAICQNINLYLNPPFFTASIIAPMLNSGSFDNCGIASMSLNVNSVNCSNIGPNNVILTVTDGSGNSSSCTSVVTVRDSMRPTIVSQNITVYLTASGNVTITPAMIDNGSYDACGGIASMNVTPNTFTCANMGSNNVAFSVSDIFGNTAIRIVVVTVLDTIAPVANCYNQNVYLNNVTGTISLVPGMIDNGSTDNCGITSRSISPNNFNCTNLGPNTVTLTVTDASGNSSTCTSVLTVLDSMRPVATCQNLNLYLNPPFATAGIFPGMLNNGSYDNCGIASMSVSPTSVNCSNVGPTNVTLTVTDNSGNVSTCTSVVTVRDSLRPVANCQNITVTLNASGTASITGAMVNNGSTDLCGIASMNVSPNTFNCSNVGSNNVVLTVTDINGNSSTCNAIVTVVSGLSETITVDNHVNCFGGNDGQATAIPSGGSGTYTYSWLPSGGTAATSTGLSAGTYTCNITDANGCTATQTVSITEPTVLTSGSSATSILCNGGTSILTVTASGGTTPYTGTGNFTVTAGGPYTYTVTDNNGCTSTTTITITEPSALVASSSATSVLCNGGNSTVTVTGSGGTSSYTGTGTFTVTAGTYSYIVTDANGCTSTTTITITEPTVLAASSSATSVLCNGGNSTVTVTGSGGTSPYTGTGTFTQTAGTYSYIVTDANGCTSTTTITITEPTVLASGSSATSVLCNGGNATVTVTGSGGTSPYTGTGTFTQTAGTYSYIVTDANGCTNTTTITITEPTLLTSSSSTTSILCNGGTSTVTVTGSGGTSPYTGTGTFTQTAGTYSYIVTDANGCTNTTTITITEPTLLTSSSSTTSILCNGGTSTVTVTGSGGTSPYTGTGTFTETAGTYFYTVTDNNGCTSTTTITVTEPTVLASNSSATSILCNGGTSTVTVTASGGISPYTGTGTFTQTAGTYSYIVTDANGCTSTTTITITEPTVLASGSSATSVLCNGGNATVTVTGSGGTSPYTGTGTFTQTAGTYSYIVTDANGCTSTTTITITEPTVLASGSSATSVLCNGGNATVTVTGSGGTSPYTGTGTFTQTAGTYSYIVTDANGCTSTTTITLTEPNAITTSVISTNVSCFGGANGSIDLTVTGGTLPYSFDWNSGTYLTEDISGLFAGTYTGVLTDANGCTDSGTIIITEPAALVATLVSASNPTSCGGTEGAIDISITGGTPGYTFLWNTSVTTEDITGIGAGTYTCTVTDTNGCITTVNASLSDPNAPLVTFALAMDTACQTTTSPFTLSGESPAGGTFSGPGVTGNGFDPMQANLGTNIIYYTYTDGNGCTASAVDSIFVDVCIGIVPSVTSNSFTIMPNPNNGTFVLEHNTTEAADVMICDALGQVVSLQKIQPGVQQQFDIATSGIYMVIVITSDGKRSTQRVIVNK